MKIRYLKNKEINLKSWDNCISNSFNGILYAYSWYLDILSEGWEALVYDDYKIVMPLTKKTKKGISYLAQPFFTQQLGVFSLEKLNAEIVEIFYKTIPRKYILIDINFNSFNKINFQNVEKNIRKTYLLDLIQDYECTKKNYSKNIKKNIKKANKNGITIRNSVVPNDLINLFKENVNLKEFKEKEYNNIRKLMSIARRKKIGMFYSAYTKENNLCGASFFISIKNRVFYLFSASSKEGREKSAMFALIDNFIRSNSRKNLTLDFEGSNIEGIAYFYKGFGSKPSYYTNVRKNKLPKFIKFFMKF